MIVLKDDQVVDDGAEVLRHGQVDDAQLQFTVYCLLVIVYCLLFIVLNP